MTTGLLSEEKAPYAAFTRFFLTVFMMLIKVFSHDNHWRNQKLHIFSWWSSDVCLLMHIFDAFLTFDVTRSKILSWKPVCDFIRLVIENKCFGYELFYSVAVMYPDLQIRWGGWGVLGGQAVVQTLRPDFSYQAVNSFQEFSFLSLLPQDSQTRNNHSKIYWNDVQKICRAVFRKHKA